MWPISCSNLFAVYGGPMKAIPRVFVLTPPLASDFPVSNTTLMSATSSVTNRRDRSPVANAHAFESDFSSGAVSDWLPWNETVKDVGAIVCPKLGLLEVFGTI